MKIVKYLRMSLIATAAILMSNSCTTPKKVTYLQDIPSGTEIVLSAANDIKVKPNDKLSIIINSKDPVLSDLFNLPVVSHRVGSGDTPSNLANSQYVSYYTVDDKGNIDFPLLGEIHVAGYNRQQLASYIKNLLIDKGLVKDPVVIVEFMDAAIYVLGDVNSPGRFIINRDRVNLLEGLSYAGDLNVTGMRENVLILREENGKQVAYRVDLTDANQLLTSPAYYLQQNDIIYVEPNSMKKRSTTVNGNTALSASFWVSVASLLTSVAVLIFK